MPLRFFGTAPPQVRHHVCGGAGETGTGFAQVHFFMQNPFLQRTALASTTSPEVPEVKATLEAGDQGHMTLERALVARYASDLWHVGYN